MSKPILLVDDSAADVALAMEALSELRLDDHVAVARDGEQALSFLRRDGSHSERAEGNPCVVILDVKMPRMSGFEVLSAIRSDPRLSRVPVVMLSTSADRADVERSYALGANGYVVKSLSFSEFSGRLRDLGRYWTAANEPPPGSVVPRA